jgi:regulation of enolase protein 1 (concanavalin A-like superfamily)
MHEGCLATGDCSIIRYVHQEDEGTMSTQTRRVWDSRVGLPAAALLVLSGSACASPLTLYDQPNRGGTGTVIAETHTVFSGGEIPGGLNNKISSFQLDQGYMVIVADQAEGFTPSKTYIAADSPRVVDTLPAQLDNAISFIRVVPWKYTNKKGMAGAWDGDPSVGTSWFYKWSYDVPLGQNPTPARGEYVPMCWGAGATDQSDTDAILTMDEVSHLLAFNEPDNCNGQSGQWNNLCDVPTAVGYYNHLHKTGLRLGTPATREGQAGGANDWLTYFVDQSEAVGHRIDFIALHWYDWGGNPAATPNEDPTLILRRFKRYLSNAFHRYDRRPLWITEWNANINRVTAVQDGFLQLALPYLESIGYVERYSYFQPNSGTGDFFADGLLTSTGQIYSNHVSTIGYTENVLPAGWQNHDVGAASQTGAVVYANGIYTVCGNGVGTGGTADIFQFLYQDTSGDCEIVARVNSMVHRGNATQAGIMIRESLDAGSKHACMYITIGNGAAFEYRTATDHAAASSTVSGIQAPYWVKLVRQGDVLTGYTSPDGVAWSQLGSQTVSMNVNVQVGMAVASSQSAFNDATFTDVMISGGSGYNAWAAAHGMSGVLSLATNDYDFDGRINLYEYGLDGDPTNAAVKGTDPWFGDVVALGGTNWVEYIHLERTNASHGLIYAVEQTLDLVQQPWNDSLDVTVVGTGPASNSDFMTVTNRVPSADKGQEFLRLRIELE